MTALEARLRKHAALLDEAALEALASKGLLRRAQKDLERAGTLSVEDTGSVLCLAVGEHRVTLPESGAAQAKCSCPAAGVCQHILTAVLFLQKPAAGGTAATSESAHADSVAQAKAEWIGWTAEPLEQWAGKAAFRTALKIVNQAPPEISTERGLRIRFHALNAECHLVAGAGLDGVIVSGGKVDSRALVIAAVIGFQQAQGIAWATALETGALEESAGTPRSRAEILEACQALLAETLANGLSRLSSGNQQRWSTLAVSALGVNLPRLALALRGLVDESRLAVARDAGTDPARMLMRMARAHALCFALQKSGDTPRADFVGTHRSQYNEVGNLDLAGVAAWPWRTASGYEGLTVLFWDPTAKRWCSWSDARPRHQLAGFNPISRYSQASPWEGAESPRQLVRSSFRLVNARRNAAFRLSGSSRSQAMITGPSEPALTGMPIFTHWDRVDEHLGAQSRIGLVEPDPLEAIVALRPRHWAERAFDPVRQTFAWILIDEAEQMLILEIPFAALNEPAIRRLETLPIESLGDTVVIGRATRESSRLTFFPFALHQPGLEITCLALDGGSSPARAVNAASPAEDAEANEWESVESEAEEVVVNTPLIRLLDDLDDNLLALAESGTANPNISRHEKLKQQALRLQRWNLELLARDVERLSLQVPNAEGLLRCSYLSQLHRRAMGA